MEHTDMGYSTKYEQNILSFKAVTETCYNTKLLRLLAGLDARSLWCKIKEVFREGTVMVYADAYTPRETFMFQIDELSDDYVSDDYIRVFVKRGSVVMLDGRHDTSSDWVYLGDCRLPYETELDFYMSYSTV